MIFISGIHGVGKTYFCNQVKQAIDLDSYLDGAEFTLQK